MGGKTALSFPEATLKTRFDLSSPNHRDYLARNEVTWIWEKMLSTRLSCELCPFKFQAKQKCYLNGFPFSLQGWYGRWSYSALWDEGQIPKIPKIRNSVQVGFQTFFFLLLQGIYKICTEKPLYPGLHQLSKIV